MQALPLECLDAVFVALDDAALLALAPACRLFRQIANRQRLLVSCELIETGLTSPWFRFAPHGTIKHLKKRVQVAGTCGNKGDSDAYSCDGGGLGLGPGGGPGVGVGVGGSNGEWCMRHRNLRLAGSFTKMLQLNRTLADYLVASTGDESGGGDVEPDGSGGSCGRLRLLSCVMILHASDDDTSSIGEWDNGYERRVYYGLDEVSSTGSSSAEGGGSEAGHPATNACVVHHDYTSLETASNESVAVDDGSAGTCDHGGGNEDAAEAGVSNTVGLAPSSSGDDAHSDQSRPLLCSNSV